MEKWFYAPVWRQRVQGGGRGREGGGRGGRGREKKEAAGRWVVVGAGEGGSGERIAAAGRRAGMEVELMARQGGYEEKMEELERRGWWGEEAGEAREVVVVHTWLMEEGEGWEESGVYSVMELGRVLGERGLAAEMVVVSRGMQVVTGEEEGVEAGKGAVLGVLKVMPQEYGKLRWRSLDVEGNGRRSGEEEAGGGGRGRVSGREEDLVVREIRGEEGERGGGRVVAWRGGRRWEQGYEAVAVAGRGQGEEERNGDEERKGEAEQDSGGGGLRRRGVYMIRGGLGGMGLTVAEYLVEAVEARVALVGRRSFPVREQWEEWKRRGASEVGEGEAGKVVKQVERLQGMEQRGGEVLVLQADVADREAMATVVRQIEQRWGRIHGVIHAAGMVGQEMMRSIGETRREDVEGQFRSKVYGLETLGEVVRGADFDVLCSSLSTVLGGLGYGAYAAANAYMDSYAQVRGRPWLSVNWDGWRWEKAGGEQGRRAGIEAEEGREVWERVLHWAQSADAVPQLIVSVSDLAGRLRQWVEEVGAVATATLATVHARPALENEYVAPRNDIERRLADLWSQVLGLTPIGIYDNFFELGGHSLLAMKIINSIRSDFPIKLSMNAIIQNPTVEQMALWIETQLAVSEVTTTQAADQSSVGTRTEESVAGPNALQSAAPVLVEIKPIGSLEPLFLVHP